MNRRSRYGVPAFDRPHRMISGVCAAAAALADVPVWMVRVAAVSLLVLHGGLALFAYFAAALIWRQNIRAVLAGTSGSNDYCRPQTWQSNMRPTSMAQSGTWNQGRRMP
jgi:phage shock protein PspC (stress-responsive transcriptional regulator)